MNGLFYEEVGIWRLWKCSGFWKMHGAVNEFENIGLFYGDIDSLLPCIERSSGAVCCSVLQCVAVYYSIGAPRHSFHVTRQRGALMRHVTHINMSCHTYQCLMSHIWMPHVTHMNASCHTYGCLMSHIWMPHTSHVGMPHVSHINASCHTYKCALSHNKCLMSRIRMRSVTHVSASWPTYEWGNM